MLPATIWAGGTGREKKSAVFESGSGIGLRISRRNLAADKDGDPRSGTVATFYDKSGDKLISLFDFSL